MPRYLRLLALMFWLLAVPVSAQSCGGAGQPACTRTATFLGATGEDYVSTSPYVFSNRIPDWHLRLTGLPLVPVSATVMAINADGVETFRWVTKGDGKNWAAWMIASAAQVDLWIEPRWAAVSFDMLVTYATGATELVAGIPAVPTAPPDPIPPSPPPPAPVPTVTPLVIEIGVPACALETPPCFETIIKLVPITP